MSVKKVTITNKEIYNRVKNGETQKAISEELGVSAVRISQIYQKEKSLEDDLKDELYALCFKFADSKNTATRIYRGLRRGDRFYNVPNISTVDELRDLPMDKIVKLRNIGAESVQVIEKMKANI